MYFERDTVLLASEGVIIKLTSEIWIITIVELKVSFQEKLIVNLYEVWRCEPKDLSLFNEIN